MRVEGSKESIGEVYPVAISCQNKKKIEKIGKKENEKEYALFGASQLTTIEKRFQYPTNRPAGSAAFLNIHISFQLLLCLCA